MNWCKFSVFLVIFVAVLMELQVSTEAQAGASEEYKKVEEKLRICSLLSYDATNNDDGPCCEACVDVLSIAARDATDYWKVTYLFRWVSSCCGVLLCFIFILLWSKFAISKRMRSELWLGNVVLSLIVAFTAVGAERLILSDEAEKLISADRDLRGLADTGFAFSSANQKGITCPDVIENRYNNNEQCRNRLKGYSGLFFPGFEKSNGDVLIDAQLDDQMDARKKDILELLKYPDAEILPKIKPSSVSEVYRKNLIFKDASKKWLGLLARDPVPFGIILFFGPLLAVIFGIIKKKVNIKKTTPRDVD